MAAIIPDPRPPALSHLWTVRVCDDLFKVRWHFVPGATGYDLNMSGNHRQSWQRKMTNKNVNAWQFSQWTKNATFWFAVRAVNAHGASEWRYVKSIAPPCQVEGLQASRVPSADGQSGNHQRFLGSGQAGQRLRRELYRRRRTQLAAAWSPT